jgi:hypothetical protein
MSESEVDIDAVIVGRRDRVARLHNFLGMITRLTRDFPAGVPKEVICQIAHAELEFSEKLINECFEILTNLTVIYAPRPNHYLVLSR